MPVIRYRGQPVITFALVDRVHRRPDGTARRTFNENEARFVEGEDFFDLTSDEIRTMSADGVFPPRTARGKLITRRGYLKLAKPLTDDRAWAVQGEHPTGIIREQPPEYHRITQGDHDVARLGRLLFEFHPAVNDPGPKADVIAGNEDQAFPLGEVEAGILLAVLGCVVASKIGRKSILKRFQHLADVPHDVPVLLAGEFGDFQ